MLKYSRLLNPQRMTSKQKRIIGNSPVFYAHLYSAFHAASQTNNFWVVCVRLRLHILISAETLRNITSNVNPIPPWGSFSLRPCSSVISVQKVLSTIGHGLLQKIRLWIFNRDSFDCLFLSAWLNNSKRASPVLICSTMCTCICAYGFPRQRGSLIASPWCVARVCVCVFMMMISWDAATLTVSPFTLSHHRHLAEQIASSSQPVILLNSANKSLLWDILTSQNGVWNAK